MPKHDFPDVEIHLRDSKDGYHVHIQLDDGSGFDSSLPSDLLSWFPSGDAQHDGQRLFDALFAEQSAREGWGATRRRCRVRLRLDTRTPELHALPWELVHDGQTFLAANSDTPFSRYLDVPIPWGNPVVEQPLRVLAALSNPADLSQPQYNLTPLDMSTERARLEALWRDLPVEPVFLEPPVTLERLDAALREQRPHILHLMAHGTFSQRRDQAALFLQDDAGNTSLVQDADFAGVFDRLGQDRPRLVFLVACESATRSTVDVFAGLSPKLVQAGVPAVVAMNDQVAITATHKLTPAFYADLFRHGEVDRALNAARSLLLTGQSPDAGVPVLLMRLKDGNLWDTAHTGATARRDFYAHAPHLDPERYVNRPHEYDQIKALLLADTATVGITTALRGAGGFGKTTLARALCDDADIQARFSDGILWATLGETPDVLARLREWVTALGGVIAENALTIPQLVNRLADLLHDGDYLLLIDDVWDGTALTPFLCGGPRCAHLVTTRNHAMLPVAAQPVNVDAMQTPEAVTALVYGLDIVEDLPESTAFRDLAQRLGHWPLLLGIINGVLRESCAQGAVVTDALMEVTKGLDEVGLTAFDATDATDRTRAVRATMEVSLSHLTPIERARYTELAIFSEDTDIPVTAAARLWGQTGDLSVFKTKDLFRRLAGVSLVQAYDSGRQTLRLHDVIRQYLIESLGAEGCTAAHHALVKAYRNTRTGVGWHTVPDDGYIYAHLAYHLNTLADADSDAAEELRALFADDAWLKARVSVDGHTYDGYLTDLDYAWRRAEQRTRHQVSANMQSDMLAECIRYALIRTTVNSLAGNYVPELVIRALETGFWTVEQCLSVVRYMPDAEKRAKMALLLLETEKLSKEYSAEVQQIGLTAARMIGPWERSRYLNKLAPHLEERYIPDVLTVALETLPLEFEHAEYKAAVLAMLAPYLEGDEKKRVLSQGLDAMRVITWRVSYVRALAEFVPYMEPHERLVMIREGFTVACAIKDDSNRADALAALAPYMEEELVLASLIVVQKFDYDGYRSKVLIALAPQLTENALTEALEIADRTLDRQKRIDFLTSLVPHLPIEKRHSIISNILRLLQNDWKERRAEILTLLAPYMKSQMRAKVLKAELMSAIAMKAREEEWKEENAWYRTKILATLLPHLKADQQELALTEALESIQDVAVEESRVDLLKMLAPYLRGASISKGLTIAQQFSDQYWRAVVLASLAPQLDEHSLEECITAVQALDGENRSMVLAALAPKLSRDSLALFMLPQFMDINWLQEMALDLLKARKIARTSLAIPELMKIESVSFLQEVAQAKELVARASYCMPVKRAQILTEGLVWGLAITDKTIRVQVLTTLIPQLENDDQEHALEEALMAIDEITSDWERGEVLQSLIPYIEGDQLKKGLQLALEIKDAEKRTDVLVRLIPRLEVSMRRCALRESLTAMKQILNKDQSIFFGRFPYLVDQLMLSLIPYIEGDLLEEGIAVALEIEDTRSRAEALAALAFQVQVKTAVNVQDMLQEIRLALLECLWTLREAKRSSLLQLLTENESAFIHAFSLSRAAWLDIAAVIIGVGRWAWQ